MRVLSFFRFIYNIVLKHTLDCIMYIHRILSRVMDRDIRISNLVGPPDIHTNILPDFRALRVLYLISGLITETQMPDIRSIPKPWHREHGEAGTRSDHGTVCPKMYRKSVLHLLKYRFAVYKKDLRVLRSLK